MRKISSFAAILLASFCGGCITTSMQGYADRELPAKQIQHIASYVSARGSLAPQLQSTISDEARKRGILVDDVLVLLPPTRTYNNTEVQKALAQSGVDAVLIIDVGDTGIISQYAGTFFQSQTTGGFSADGTATRAGNMTNISLSGASNSTTTATATPIYRQSRQTNFNARLLEVATGRTLWVGKGQVNASGLLFVGDGANASSSMSAIFEDLQKKGVIINARS